MILVMDTADSKAFLGLWSDGWKAKLSWEAGRSLSADILNKLEELYQAAGIALPDTTGIVVKSGPGSFTGLRIGLSVANALAFARNIPIVGIAEEANPEKIAEQGSKLLNGKKEFDGAVIPLYGSEPKISKPKKD